MTSFFHFVLHSSSGYISKRMFEHSPGFSRRRAKYLEGVRYVMDEEKHVASLCDKEECQGTCKLTPALHHRSSNQEEARGFSKRVRREGRWQKTKDALTLRCDGDDAKMSLVVRRREKVCAVFMKRLVYNKIYDRNFTETIGLTRHYVKRALSPSSRRCLSVLRC